MQNPIPPDEAIGRRVKSSRRAEAARENKIRTDIFIDNRLDEYGRYAPSIDRLSIGVVPDHNDIKTVAIDEERSLEHKLYGWCVLKAGQAAADGRSTEISPTDLNPYHGSIVLPVAGVIEDVKDDLRHHAQQLKRSARWMALAYDSESTRDES